MPIRPTAERTQQPGPDRAAPSRQAATAPGASPTAAITRLQRTAGNQAVTRLLQRQIAAPSVQEQIHTALTSHDNDDIQAIRDYGAATEAQRMSMLRDLFAQTWVGPMDEAAAERIWNSFGTQLPRVADRNAALWTEGIERGVDPSNIAAANQVRASFGRDVQAAADHYLQQNLAYCTDEQQRLGLRAEDGAAGPTAAIQQQLHLEQVQQTAAQAQQLLEQQHRLTQTTIGYTTIINEHGPRMYVPVGFDPKGPGHAGTLLESDPHTGARAPHTWAELKPLWDQSAAALSAITATDPTVYAAVAAGGPTLGTLANGSPQQARSAAEQVLSRLHSNIVATGPKLHSGELDWRDLVPIQQQLYGGQVKGASGIDWSTPFAKGIGQDVIGDHQTTEFWIQLGLGTAAAALFIVAEIGSAGLVTPALLGGLAISGGQALSAWSNYEDLATAAGTATSSQTQLVSEGQVDAARINAIIATIAAVIDVGAPIVRAGSAAMATARLEQALASRSIGTALEQGFRDAAVQGADAVGLVERGIAELGVRDTLARSGKSAEELLAMLPADSPAAARLREAIASGLTSPGAEGQVASTLAGTGTTAEQAFMQGKSMSELMRGVVGAVKGRQLSRELGEKLVQESIEQLGPAETVRLAGGWKPLSEALGGESVAGRRLMAWRDAVFDDLERYVRDDLHGSVQRTGTQENFTNDIDMSFTGANASAVREQASAYLARRLGVADDAGQFDMMLMAGLFTDPRRMHLYDHLPSALRQELAQREAATQRQLIWNRRLWEATQHADTAPEMAGALRRQMNELGIPEFTYRPLAEGDRIRLGARIDSLHAQLDQAIAAGDLDAQQSLVRQIADSQALVNASEGGGYFSAGGVRRYVSERPNEAGFERPGNVAAPPLPAEQLTAILDQLPKLDHSLLELASGDSSRLVAGVRGIGKYGNRLVEVTREARGFDESAWSALAERCLELKRVADQGAKSGRLATEAQAVVRDARQLSDELIAMSDTALAEVRQAVQLPDVANAAQLLQTMTLAHVKLLRATDWAVHNLRSVAFALRTGTRLAEVPTDDSAAGPVADE